MIRPCFKIWCHHGDDGIVSCSAPDIDEWTLSTRANRKKALGQLIFIKKHIIVWLNWHNIESLSLINFLCSLIIRYVVNVWVQFSFYAISLLIIYHYILNKKGCVVFSLSGLKCCARHYIHYTYTLSLSSSYSLIMSSGNDIAIVERWSMIFCSPASGFNVLAELCITQAVKLLHSHHSLKQQF